MQVLSQSKKTVLIVCLLVVILIVTLFIFQNASQPPLPPAPSSYTGEVTQYQNQSLTSISAFIQELNQHPDVSIKGTQNLNQTTYRLTVNGLVNKTMEYAYQDVVDNFQSYQQVGKLPCVEGWSVTMLWQGVLVNDLLQDAGVSPNATTIIFTASDGYTTELP